jgi:hypothetical protein
VKSRAWTPAVAAIAAAVLASCSTFYDIHFVPAPIEARIADDTSADAVARALVSVSGVRRPDSEHRQPARFELRMRIENLGKQALEIEPDSFELVSADLQPFGAPQFQPVPDRALGPNESIAFDLAFPVPDGSSIDNYDLRGLNLKWAVRMGDKRVISGVSFQRFIAPAYYGYYDPFYPGWGCGGWHGCVGVGVGKFCAY